MLILGEKTSRLIEYVRNSYLELNYYQKGSDSPTIIFFPFVGTVDIKETRENIFTEYQPISRNTTLFGYTGSKSRNFTISYVINADYLFKHGNLLPKINPSPSFKKGTALFTPSEFSSRLGGLSNFVGSADTEDMENKRQAHAFIDYQINIVRSMAVNNADQPTQGPPIVRLNHGLLYQDVPCVCKTYNISQDSGTANDVAYASKLSNKTITIEISLSETRTGDYQKTAFDPTSEKSRDNIVGWQQILKGGSLDPITPIYLN